MNDSDESEEKYPWGVLIHEAAMELVQSFQNGGFSEIDAKKQAFSEILPNRRKKLGNIYLDRPKWMTMRVSKGHSFSDDQKNENQSSISVFRFSILKNNLENKISIYFKFIKGPTVFRARDKRKNGF